MTKFARVFLTIIAVLLIIGAALVTVAAIFFGQQIASYFSEDSVQLQGDEKTITMSAAELESLSLSLINANITINTEDVDTARITYKLFENEDIEEITSGGSLGLDEGRHFTFFNFNNFFRKNTRPVTVTLPSSVKVKANISVVNGKIDISESSYVNLRINSTNGTIILNDVKSDADIYTEGVNGEINITNSTAKDKMTLKTVNGKVISDKLFAGELSCKTVNGPVSIDNVTCPNIRCETVNGSIASSVYGEMDDYNITFNSVNGNIFVNGSKYGREADINTSSINRINLNTVNGRAEINFINQ